MNTIRTFISYSHENSIWLTEWLDPVRQLPNPRYLLKQWQRAFRRENVEFWYDREEDKGLRGGERWRERIFAEIDRADLCILLVTQDFVISPFIMDEELPRILARHRDGQTEILPVLLQPTRLKDLPIGTVLQWTPGGPTPLSEYHDRSTTEFDKARNQILDSMEMMIQRVKRSRSTGGVATKAAPAPASRIEPKTENPSVSASVHQAAPASSRFEVREVDGVRLILDSKTSLMWVQPEGKFTWDGARSMAETVPFGGYQDWRLPAIEELKTLVSSTSAPFVDTDVFKNFSGSYVYSSVPAEGGGMLFGAKGKAFSFDELTEFDFYIPLQVFLVRGKDGPAEQNVQERMAVDPVPVQNRAVTGPKECPAKIGAVRVVQSGVPVDVPETKDTENSPPAPQIGNVRVLARNPQVTSAVSLEVEGRRKPTIGRVRLKEMER